MPKNKLPICLVVNDAAPRIHSMYIGHPVFPSVSPRGNAMLPDIPNDFLDEFCDIAERETLRGKFSIVPMTECRGDILHGFPDFPDSEIRYWLDTVKSRLTGRFSFTPEMLTHSKTLDLSTGAFLDCNEMEWAAGQNRETMTPYIETALRMLRDAGFHANGVTSPWSFGIEHEDDYAAAVSDAVFRVWGENVSWYCLRSRMGKSRVMPDVRYRNGERRCVSVPTTTADVFWSTMDVPASEITPAYLSSVADCLMTDDGRHGAVADAIALRTIPSILVHWQSLFSNGTRAGLHALGIAAARINRHYGDAVVWTDCETLAENTQK